MGHDDSDRCVVEVKDHSVNRHVKMVWASPYGLVAEISLENGVWRLHWRTEAAVMRMRHYDQAVIALGPIIERMNILHKVTQRLTR